MRRSPPPRRAGWLNGSSGITRQNTAAGSTWRRANSAYYRRSAWTSAFPTNNPDRGGRRLGGRAEQETNQSRLAVYDRRRADKTEATLPRVVKDSGYYESSGGYWNT